jgi:hypothetical protein
MLMGVISSMLKCNLQYVFRHEQVKIYLLMSRDHGQTGLDLRTSASEQRQDRQGMARH